jgi:hypothetical protein
MGVSLEFYRAAIGMFNLSGCFDLELGNVFFCYGFVDLLFVRVSELLVMLFVACILIFLSNDVQLNPGPIQFFTIGQLNAYRSLNVGRDKFKETSSLISQNNFDIFAITETWPNEHISSDSFAIPGYSTISRRDREGRLGRGVAIYMSDSLVVKRRPDLEIAGLELLWIELRLNQNHFLCCVCYRPPINDLGQINTFLNDFQKSLDAIRDLPSDFNLINVGDFIAHYNINYPQESTDVGIRLHMQLLGGKQPQTINYRTHSSHQP